MSNPIVTITLENGEVMAGELYPDKAPNTVNNFICPLASYTFFLCSRSFLAVLGEIISTSRSGAPYTHLDWILLRSQTIIKSGIKRCCSLR